MISFTKRTVLLVALSAAGHLLVPWLMPWFVMALVLAGVAGAILLDVLLTRPVFSVSRRYPAQLQQSRAYDIEVTISNKFARELFVEVEDCTPPSVNPESGVFLGHCARGRRGGVYLPGNAHAARFVRIR